MARLLGKQVGATVVEIHGPQAGRNYLMDGTFAVAVTPEVEIQVFGAGQVQLQENLNHISVGERASNIGGQGAINTEEAANPVLGVGGWQTVGAVIDETSGAQTRTVQIGNPDSTYLRLVVTVAGDGWVHFGTKWN